MHFGRVSLSTTVLVCLCECAGVDLRGGGGVPIFSVHS